MPVKRNRFPHCLNLFSVDLSFAYFSSIIQQCHNGEVVAKHVHVAKKRSIQRKNLVHVVLHGIKVVLNAKHVSESHLLCIQVRYH